MNTIKEKDDGNIRVADITLAQLSRGLYRSTATAFKELVNNAYDADALAVRIDTNYPEFNFISCTDNGRGMPLEEFLRYFREKGVGSCIKRKDNKDKTDKYNRPIIGRLGIGMLAIGQLCHSFKIESHYQDEKGNGRAYRAELVLSDVTFPFDDKEQVLRNQDLKQQEIDVGKWKYETIDYIEKKAGFSIYSSDVRHTYKREMKGGVQRDKKNRRLEKMSFSQTDLHSRFYSKCKSVRACGPYLETIWELAILCPLPYFGETDNYPIDLASFPLEESKSDECKQVQEFIKDRQSKLVDYNFRVVFDGIELKRHIQFPTEQNTEPKLYFVSFNDKVFGSNLKFSGYLFGQISRAIRPLELNGVQIRLRQVGIGGYDSTFLKFYKEIETIRNRWVSGEIFVDEGLESALNIDRDSFNEHDEHYKRLQSHLHEKVDSVFNELSRISRKLSLEKHEVKNGKVKHEIQVILGNKSRGKFKLEQRDLGKDVPIVTIDRKRGKIILNTTLRPLRKKKANIILQSIELAYHVAIGTTKDEKERHNIFYKLLQEILEKLI
ncbi:MAG: ATP-binding protein [candidate division Zixibacteria bacterium]|nr:ATP-binding protein [candidate division Zixibacteria bacterium]